MPDELRLVLETRDGPTVFAVRGRPSLTKPSESGSGPWRAPAPQFLSERAAAPCACRRRPSLHISLAIPTCRVSPATESSLVPDEVGKVFPIGGRDRPGARCVGLRMGTPQRSASRSQPEQRPPSRQPARRPRRKNVVLIADDVQDTRDMYCAFLESRGLRAV